jgi:outer membrane protein assembly factor BamB
MALSAPTIARDGSLYFKVTGSGIKGCPLCALSHDGKKKWELPLGDQICYTPPVVASDGTLFVVDGDPKLTAVNPDGTIKWVFNPPRKLAFRLPLQIRLKIPRNWNDLKDLWKIFFPEPQHSFPASPALTSKGILYVGFGAPYNTLYALNVGVGPDTNSPWPMEMANAQRTRLLAPRPPPSGPAGK